MLTKEWIRELEIWDNMKETEIKNMKVIGYQ
jgi:hypothetical protein